MAKKKFKIQNIKKQIQLTKANKKTPFKSTLYHCAPNHIILQNNICIIRGRRTKK